MFDVYAVFPPGLEQAMAAELEHLGFSPDSQEIGGIEFKANAEELMRANLWSRVATRFLVRIANFPAKHLSQLEKASRKIDWKTYIPPNATIQIKATCQKSKIYHSAAAAERVFNGMTKSIPGIRIVGSDDADQSVLIRLHHNQCTISIDAAGAPLYQRGYKSQSVRAPLRENLAAAFIYLCDWDVESPLIDPMAGSGTIPIEAALIAGNRAPGLHDDFAFLNWPSTPTKIWQTLLEEAADVAKAIETPIFACDRDEKATEAIMTNAENAGVSDSIEVCHRPFSETIATLPEEAGLMLFNPPYGKRIGNRSPLRALFKSVSQTIEHELLDWDVGIISPQGMLSNSLQPVLMPCTPPVFHGGIRVYLFAKPGPGTSHSEVVE